MNSKIFVNSCGALVVTVYSGVGLIQDEIVSAISNILSCGSQLVHCRKKGTVINDMSLKIVVGCSFIEIIQLPAPLMDHDRATVIDGEYIVVFKQDAQDDESKS